MTYKIPCKECNELILPKTAEKTGGICMACKQGIRKDIEQAKEFYRKQKEYDAYRELWKYLVKKVNAEEDGFDKLTKEEKLYYSIGIFDGEVYNSGVEQFFTNSSGELFSEVIEGLKILKADNSLSLLRQATKILFGDVIPPKDRIHRYELMKQYLQFDNEPKPEWIIQLDKIDQQYYKNPDNLNKLLNDYAESTGLIHPFYIN